jgi:hypothetical protein
VVVREVSEWNELNDMIEFLRRQIRINRRLAVVLIVIIILNTVAAMYNIWAIIERGQ